MMQTNLTLVVVLAIAGCSSSSGVAPPAQNRALADSSGTSTNQLELEENAAESIRAQLRNRISAVPDVQKRYSILLVEPEPGVHHHIHRVKLDPNKKYSIMVVDTGAKKADPDLARYFGESLNTE